MTLLICGAGQYGLAAKEVAEATGCYETIDFLDDRNPIAVGKPDDVDKLGYDRAVVAIGNPEVRERCLSKIPSAATLIHPRAVVSPSAIVGEGCIIEAGAVISAHATVGRGCIIMANAVVGHDATVGNCCQLKYNCTVPENQTVPDRTKVDCNTVFRAAD